MSPKLTGWQLVALVAIIVPSGCGLIYLLVQSGQDIAGIAAGVVTILGALGWHAASTRSKLDQVSTEVGRVEKLANGNLSRADEARELARVQAIADLHAIYQQALQMAAAAPPGTVVVPPLPPLGTPATKADSAA